MNKYSLLTTQVVEGRQSSLVMDGAELAIIAGPDRGQTIALGPHSLILGSAVNCDIVIHDKTVSAQHAEIVASESGYTIRDLQSKNGILIGNTLILSARLNHGMKFCLGDSTIVVRALGSRHTIPLSRPGEFFGLDAQSVKMRVLVAALQRAAAADSTVLLEGETGTGKEIAAGALHAASPRSSGPFVVLDCSALTPALATAELFGYERGAFTGADESRAGVLEQADTGTLFLDEIGELSLDMQTMLLRAVENRSSRRVGGKTEVRHDVRIVAATNRNLAEEVRHNRFRQDLYYRIAVVTLRIPPLRERREDIATLAQKFAIEAGIALSPHALAMFATHDWPGNVRELRNAVLRFSILPNVSIGADVRSPKRAEEPVPPLSVARRQSNEVFEKDYLETVIARANGNISRAAVLAGITRPAFTRLVARHGLRVRDKTKAQ